MIAIFCLLLLVLFVVEETQARGFDVMQETKGDDETTGDDGDTKPGEKMTMGDEETTGDDGDTKPGAPMKGAGETDDFDDFPDATFWTKKTTKKPSSTSSGASQQRACTTSDSTFVRQCHDPWIQCDEEKIVDECECLQVYLKCANQLNCWSKLRRSVALLEYGCAQDGVGFQVAAGSDATCTASDVKFRTCLQDAPACWQFGGTCDDCVRQGGRCLRDIDCTEPLDGCQETGSASTLSVSSMLLASVVVVFVQQILNFNIV